MNNRFLHYLLGISVLTAVGCANITTPTGGKKDITAPKRLTISPADSLRNTRVKKIELTFDEYITLADAAKEVQISPLLSIQPVVTNTNKKVIVKIADSLLEENTTYRISFNNAIRDLHENNPYPAFTYVFSTGSYFDSLQLGGSVIHAATGMPDTSGTLIMLYSATENDSAIVRHAPKYITGIDKSGNFMFKGLPKKSFKIYAVKDANDNRMYDGETEMIAFLDMTVTPGDTSGAPIKLKLFTEVDTTAKEVDTTTKVNNRTGAATAKTEGFSYSLPIDTSSREKKSFDINNDIVLSFSRTPVINKDKITLSYDSSDVAVTENYRLATDPAHPNNIKLSVNWKENTLYTLKLAKGFAKDTAGADAPPAKYIFRTKDEDDYGKISIRLPGKYKGATFVLQVTADNDTIYQKQVTDTVIDLTRLRPAKYNFRIIEDRNRNGKWDAGYLFRKVQPEDVIPYTGGSLMLKAGWENTIDFEPKPEPKKTTDKVPNRK